MTTKLDIEIKELIIEVDNPLDFKWIEVFEDIKKKLHGYLIKLCLIETTPQKLFFRALSLNGLDGHIQDPFVPTDMKRFSDKKTVSLKSLIIPTGVGALFGGYAGDANPIAKALSVKCDYLLTHPNVVNGAVLSELSKNTIYLEGFLLEQFLLGKITLTPKISNKIGVIFDKGIDEKRLNYELNVLNAMQAFYGIDFAGWMLTDKPLDVIPSVSKQSYSTGTVNNLADLLDAAHKLKNIGATAIAICSCIPDLELNKNYVSGKGLDPIGGVEAILSHTVSAVTGIVSANAPVVLDSKTIDVSTIDPVSASEYIADTFLPSVISGLRYAPQINLMPGSSKEEITVNDLDNIYIPFNSFGSPGVLYLNQLDFSKTVLVQENITCLNIDPKHINTQFVTIKSYLDLVSGDDLKNIGVEPKALKRPLAKVPRIN